MKEAERRARCTGQSPAAFSDSSSSDNPFAVSRVGLAQLDFIESSPGLVDQTVAKLGSTHWSGQILGPHGSGKTTLTIALAKRLAGQFQRFTWLVISPGRWWLGRPRSRVQLAARSRPNHTGLEFLEFRSEDPESVALNRLQRLGNGELCFVDGVDQLSTGWQKSLFRAVQKKAVVWTSHRRLESGPPLLAELRPDINIFRGLVVRLLEGAGHSLESGSIDTAFARSEGDFRSALGHLYDCWEEAKRCS